MALELRARRDGLRGTWYGRYEVGRRLRQSRGAGRGHPARPVALREEGDRAFERSRERARAKLKIIVGRPGSATPRIWSRGSTRSAPGNGSARCAWRTCRRVGEDPPQAAPERPLRGAVPLDAVALRELRPRPRPQAEELGHVTRQTARAFMDAEAARGRHGQDVERHAQAPAGNVQVPAPGREHQSVLRPAHARDRDGLPQAVQPGRTQGHCGRRAGRRLHPPDPGRRHLHGHAAGRLLPAEVVRRRPAPALHHRQDRQDRRHRRHPDLPHALR